MHHCHGASGSSSGAASTRPIQGNELDTLQAALPEVLERVHPARLVLLVTLPRISQSPSWSVATSSKTLCASPPQFRFTTIPEIGMGAHAFRQASICISTFSTTRSEILLGEVQMDPSASLMSAGSIRHDLRSRLPRRSGDDAAQWRPPQAPGSASASALSTASPRPYRKPSGRDDPG